MKRQRGRGRKPGGHHQPNRSFESTGPDVKVRGNAATIYEKYLQLARDASSSGDRVMAESYLQHAEHYFRVMRAMQPAQPPPQVLDRFGQTYESDDDDDGDEAEAEADAGAEVGDSPQPYQHRDQRDQRGDQRGDRPRRFDRDRDGRDGREPREAREPREPREPRPEGAEGEERSGDDREFRRGRGRRGRYRPEGERDGPRAEGGGDRPPRPERPDRADRQERPERPERAERAERKEREPVEGFGDGVPAFLAGE